MAVRTVGDVDAIADLELIAFPLDPWSDALIEEGVAGRLPTTSYFVAEQDARFVGHAAVSVVQDVAELQRIATVPGARRTGVAAALLVAVEAARARPAVPSDCCWRSGTTTSPARAFYAERDSPRSRSGRATTATAPTPSSSSGL